MDEHLFARPTSARDRDAAATTHVAELGERLLDELARTTHDWLRIRGLALQLLRVTSAMAGPPPGRTIPRRGR